MEIKTDCSPHSQSKDDPTSESWMKYILGNGTHVNIIKKTFTFFHLNGTWCSTGALPVQNQRCKQTNYQAYELGDCGKFDFDPKNLWRGVITLHGPKHSVPFNHNLKSLIDAWTPEWVKLFLANGEVIKCSFDYEMVCKPEGKISFVLGILIFTYLPSGFPHLIFFFLFSKWSQQSYWKHYDSNKHWIFRSS